MNSPSLEARVAHVEGIVDEIRSRFVNTESRFDRLDGRIDRFQDRMTSLEGRLNSNFQWLVGLMLTMWITVLIAVLVKS